MELTLKEAMQLRRFKYYHKSDNSYIVEKDGDYYCRVKTEEDARRLTHHLKKIGFYKTNLEKALKETGIKKCKKGTNTGYYRTSKIKNQKYKLGYVYVYQYEENGRRMLIKSTTLFKLREKVLAKGLEWKREVSDKNED